MFIANPTGPARADAASADIRRYVFVPGAETPLTTVIDADTDRIVGVLQTGIVAAQVEVSRELAKLVATDGRTGSISVLDVFGGTARKIALPSPAQRLTLGTSGRILAANDLSGGTINLIDLVDERPAATITNLTALRDVMFGDKDITLYIADGGPGVGVIDVKGAKLIRRIATFRPTEAGVATLARLPNGRRALARPQSGGPISVLELERGEPVGEIDAGPEAAAAVLSGTGTYLLVPNAARRSLAVFRADKLRDPVSLPGEAAVTAIYTAWLDSVAFIPSASRRTLLVYDLDTLRLAGEIALPGRATRGAITSDSRKLYLPVLDPPAVVVVDGETRRIAATIPLPGAPLAAVVAGGWGICH